MRTLLACVLAVAALVPLCAKSAYESARLLAVNDSSSNRVVQSGSVITNVTDTEYRMNVELNGVIYVCSYWPRWRWSYEPNDFVVNDAIDVRISGKHLFIKRPNGKELKTAIIRRIRAEDHSSAQKPSAQ